MRTQTQASTARRAESEFPVRRLFWVLLLLLLAAGRTSAVAPGVGGPKTTLVIFSDHPVAESGWAALFAQLRRGAAIESHNFPSLDPDPEIVRGIDVVPGRLTENPIVVKLHGDCAPPVGVRPFPSEAPLGWVRREEGHISSFIQVDCTHLAQLISSRVLWMNGGQKSAAMSGAIARVILHEWIHIAEQSDHHGRKGISQARFGIEDLLSGFDSEIGSNEPAGARSGKPAAKGQPE